MARDEHLDDWNRLRAARVLRVVAAEQHALGGATFELFGWPRVFDACPPDLRGWEIVPGWSAC